jgi:hypothetical protein
VRKKQHEDDEHDNDVIMEPHGRSLELMQQQQQQQRSAAPMIGHRPIKDEH